MYPAPPVTNTFTRLVLYPAEVVYFSWTKLHFVAFNSQWQSASDADWALPLAREQVVRPCTDQPVLGTVHDLSAVPSTN